MRRSIFATTNKSLISRKPQTFFYLVGHFNQSEVETFFTINIIRGK